MRRGGAGQTRDEVSGNELARSDPDEMGDAECVRHARGMFAARGNGAGRDFQRRPQAETIKGPAWVLIGQALGGLVARSDAEDGVRKGVVRRAVSPGRG